MNALERGSELMLIKNRDLPLLAMRYRNALCKQVGGCMEIFLTAFCWYAEKEEGMPPSGDSLYDLNENDGMVQAVIALARSSTWVPDWWNESKESSR